MVTAALKSGSSFDPAAGIAPTNVVTAALTGGSSNDYNPSGLPASSDLLVKVSTATQFLTGIVSAARPGRRLNVINDAASTFNLVLKNLDSGSSANNRFNAGADITIKPGQAMPIVWHAAVSGGSAGWRTEASAYGLDGIIAKDASELDINTNASKATLYSFTVPGGTLGTDRTLCLDIQGDYINNSGAGKTITIEVAYGATVIYADISGNIATSATRHPFFFSLRLSAKNATNAQTLGGILSIGTSAGATTGLGDLAVLVAGTTGALSSIYGTAAEDSTADKTLTVSITHSASGSTVGIRRENAIAYMLGAGAVGAPGPTGASGAGTVSIPINAQTGTTYTLDISDVGKQVACNNASAITVTIPAGVFAVGDNGEVSQVGAGAVTFVGGIGLNPIQKPHTLTTAGQYCILRWHCVGTNTFRISGEST